MDRHVTNRFREGSDLVIDESDIVSYLDVPKALRERRDKILGEPEVPPN